MSSFEKIDKILDAGDAVLKAQLDLIDAGIKRLLGEEGADELVARLELKAEESKKYFEEIYPQGSQDG